MNKYRGALSREALQRAWEDVWANDQADGVLQPAIKRFAGTAPQQLDALAASLADASYTPGFLTEVGIPKATGGLRVLHVPTVQDRVVERAILRAVSPTIDPLLGPGVFAYRPGLGVQNAVQRVVELREEGHSWAVRTDIDNCFPSIDPARTLRLFGSLVNDERLIELVTMLLDRSILSLDGQRVSGTGLPQGGPLSPLLANVALEGLDSALLDAGFPVTRYADDLVIVCRSESAGNRAVSLAEKWLNGVGMTLKEEKTEVMSFERGFCFLGEDFGSRYPPLLDGASAIKQQYGQVLYVARQGGRIRIRSGRVIVESSDKEQLLSIPTNTITQVLCFGSVGFSAGAREWAMRSDVPVLFLSRRGNYQGQLFSKGSKRRSSRLRSQVTLAAETSLSIARELVRGKLNKQAVLLRHFTRDTNAEVLAPAVKEIRTYAGMLGDAESVNELMGLEGAAARSYFAAWRSLLPPELNFTGRNRKPPMDVINAALGYAYAVLLGECVSAVMAAGLEPSIGCLHTDSRAKPALALDLMEEFRPTIVDQVVVQYARAKVLRPEHGTEIQNSPGVHLTKAGKAALMDVYERRMLTTVKALPDFKGSWRRHLYRQAQRLGKAIVTNDPGAYTGLSWR